MVATDSSTEYRSQPLGFPDDGFWRSPPYTRCRLRRFTVAVFRNFWRAMMSETSDRSPNCPEEQTWQMFVSGKLSSDDAQLLREHSSSCSICQAAIQRLTAKTPPDASASAAKPHDTADQFTELTNTKQFHRDDKQGNPGAFEIEEFEFEHTLLTPSTQPESLGKLGKYEIHKIIGSGAFGVVLKAFDEQLRRAVAIKILNRQFSSSATARRRFIREARAAAAVSHSNVVAIHAVEEQAGTPFLVMELVTGPSLRDRISEMKKLPPIEVIRLGAQIASGLAAAHAQGVVHRDIKPGNIMLEKSLDRVKITDFGLARVAIDNIELTSRGMAMGTPAYMSPEQIAGDNDKIDARSDLFALGCVLFAALVGHSPFQGRTALEMARRVSEYDPTPLSQLDPSIPQFLSDLVEQLLKKNPEDRYQSAAEVAGLLNRYLVALNQASSDKFQSVLHAPLLRTQVIKTDDVRRPFSQIKFISVIVLALGAVGAGLWNYPPTKKVPERTDGQKLGNSLNGIVRKTDSVVSNVELQELTVSQSGDAQFKSLSEALAKVTPKTTIRILDDAIYRESLMISGDKRFSGLKIIAEKRATLAVPNPSNPTPRLIEISQVDDVLLKGWKIDAPKDGHAVYTVEAGSIVLEDLIIEQPADVGLIGAIQIHAMRSPKNGPVEVKNCHIVTAGEAHCVWIHATNLPPSEIRLTGNRFERRSNVGTNIAVWLNDDATLEGLSICNNLIIKGHCALSLFLHGKVLPKRIEIKNNTFFQSPTWLAFDTVQAKEPIARIVNNLIIGSDHIDSPNIDEAPRHWEFRSNWWELGPTTEHDPGRSGMVAESKMADSLKFLSRDPAHPEFMRPAPSATWLESGTGGAEGKYVGAFEPNSNTTP